MSKFSQNKFEKLSALVQSSKVGLGRELHNHGRKRSCKTRSSLDTDSFSAFSRVTPSIYCRRLHGTAEMLTLVNLQEQC